MTPDKSGVTEQTPRHRTKILEPGLPLPMQLNRRQFEELVADALDAIPPELASLMEDGVVVVDGWPKEEQLDEHGDVFGLYEGTDHLARSPLSYSGAMPDRITIFRGPLSMACRTSEDLAEEILVTVVHEVAHHFGITDERLEELGWD